MPQNNSTPSEHGYNTQADEHRSIGDGKPPKVSLNIAKDLHNVPAASSAENAPRLEAKEGNYQPPRRRKWSLSGGNDGHGAPLFSNLEASRGKHMADGYEDMKPPDGIFGAAFKRWVGHKHGSGIAQGK